MRVNALLVGGLAAALLGGCAGPVTLHNSPVDVDQLTYASGSTSPAEPADPCVLALGEVSDGRSITGDMTDSAGLPIHHEDFIGWVRDRILLLKYRNMRFATPDLAPTRPRVDIVVVKAYLQHLSTSMSANVVLRLHVTRPNTPPIEQYARGRDTGMNWVSGQGEIQSLFNQALAQAVSASYEELRPLCIAPTPENSVIGPVAKPVSVVLLSDGYLLGNKHLNSETDLLHELKDKGQGQVTISLAQGASFDKLQEAIALLQKQGVKVGFIANK